MGTRDSWPRWVVGAIAVALVLSAARISYGIYRAQRDPLNVAENATGAEAPPLTPASALNRAADAALEKAVAVLNDRSLAGVERIRGYREELGRAEDLLVGSLRAQPRQAWTLARLAAVRFELDAPSTPAAEEALLRMIERASAMAPRVARVQAHLGELLFRMGKPDAGFGYLARAVAIDPQAAFDAVKAPREAGVPADDILAALSSCPEVLVALYPVYAEQGRLAAFLDAADPVLDRANARLLAAYASGALSIGDAARLERAIERIGPRDEPEFEAERLVQRARARLALGRAGAAMADVAEARRLVPDSAGLAERAGQVALAAQRPEEALVAYRDALGRLARLAASPSARARIYRQIGQAEEAAGRPQRAYDAYARALRLDPEEAIAKARMAAMQGAAGVAPK